MYDVSELHRSRKRDSVIKNCADVIVSFKMHPKNAECSCMETSWLSASEDWIEKGFWIPDFELNEQTELQFEFNCWKTVISGFKVGLTVSCFTVYWSKMYLCFCLPGLHLFDQNSVRSQTSFLFEFLFELVWKGTLGYLAFFHYNPLGPLYNNIEL